MIKIHISPDFIGSSETGGIRRVVEAMLKYLPDHGIEHTRILSEADIIVNHGAMPTKYKTTPSLHVGHGLYWSRQGWGDGYLDVNRGVVSAMKRAVAHTVPSEWVNRAVRRGGLWYPEVVYHGVDPKLWKPKECQNFVLWNKARADYVSDPGDLMRVASLLKKVQFRSTLGNRSSNVSILNPMPYKEMRATVASAGVLLATARETFGIGTLEAMAAGVPIAGWDWGGQSEIVIQGETGYLAPPGDYPALAECIQKCLDQRSRLSKNAMEDVKTRWTWPSRIAQYAAIIERIHKEYYVINRPKVSVIVTAFNLDRYLIQCLESVAKQTFTDFECVVIDDALSDSTKSMVEEFVRKDKRFRYLRPTENLGLSGARNFGFSRAHGRYIRHLDADDFLHKNALAIETNALDKDQEVHIVYGHIETVRSDGSRIEEGGKGNFARSGWPEDKFDWFAQMSHLNQLPSCSMMRREVLERSGGYRVRMTRAEDAEFWCRVSSLGFVIKKCTQAVTYFHRHREDSKGATEWRDEGKEPDWTSWFPWRMGAGDYDEGRKIMAKTSGIHPHTHLVPFGAQGNPTNTRFWYVHDYYYPVVSIIVTCGPGHEKYLQEALDSVQAQSFPDWECIVVNDTGKEWGPDIMGSPFAQVVNMDGNQGISAARNKGFEYANGEFIVWLDADDILLPWFLERMVAYAEVNDGVIYCDMIQDKGEKLEIYRYREFKEIRIPTNMQYPGSSVLIPRHIVLRMLKLHGGWDEDIPGMEDWNYQVGIHDAGFCAFHIEEALFVYRIYSSTKREVDHARIKDIAKWMDHKWKKYRKDGVIMGCGCGSKAVTKVKPKSTMSSSGNFENLDKFLKGTNSEQLVKLEYLGPREGTFTIRSRVMPSKSYRFGNNRQHKIQTVFMQDAEYLVQQVGPDAKPYYRMITGGTMEFKDPSVVLGRPLA